MVIGQDHAHRFIVGWHFAAPSDEFRTRPKYLETALAQTHGQSS